MRSMCSIGLVLAVTSMLTAGTAAAQSALAGASEGMAAVADRPIQLALYGARSTAQVKTRAAEDRDGEDDWLISGPISLRSADPEPIGEWEFKQIFGWSTSRNGENDAFEFEAEIEYGLAEDHELLFASTWEVGEGRVDGSGDMNLGWHWRFSREQDLMPAMAMRNWVRIPAGIDSAGVDYRFVGLITKTLIPGQLRGHINPFFASINGNNEEDARHFQWGVLAGVDYRTSDDLLLIAAYRYASGEIENTRDNHSLELGCDWEMMDDRKLGLAVEIGLDGDRHGPAFAATVSYIVEIGD